MIGPVCIYGLFADDDPDCEIRYVGKTGLAHLERRVRQHINTVNRRHTPKNSWIKAVIARGSTIKASIIETCDYEQWEDRERFWIAHYREIGRLTNVCDGGDSGPDMTGHRHTDEVKAIIAKHSTGRKPSPETLAKRSAALKGRVMSPEWIEKARQTRIKNHQNGDRSWENGIKAAIAANTGTKHSPERIKKISDAQKGKPAHTNALLATRKPVKCVETGTWFASISEATARCGFYRTSIINAIKNNGCAGGFHWQYADRRILSPTHFQA